MKTYSAMFALVSALFLSACNTQPNQEKAYSDLFSSDLSNAQCSENVWSFKDGILESTKDVILFTKDDHSNFEVDLEFRIEKGSNGGFIFYVSDMKDWTNNSLEIQICDNTTTKDPKSMCGGVFGHVAPEWNSQLTYGDWHNLRVICKGQNIETWLDGKRVSTMDMAKWTDSKRNPDGSAIPNWLSKHKKSEMKTSGKIGLQGRHGKANCQYRNLKIRSL